jgi:hypothetical protein
MNSRIIESMKKIRQDKILLKSLRWSVLFRKLEIELLSPSGILSLVSVINCGTDGGHHD